MHAESVVFGVDKQEGSDLGERTSWEGEGGHEETKWNVLAVSWQRQQEEEPGEAQEHAAACEKNHFHFTKTLTCMMKGQRAM